MRLTQLLIRGMKPEDGFLYKKNAPKPQPMVAPTAPVEEASVEIDDESKKKARTGKSALKTPLATAASTGLKL